MKDDPIWKRHAKPVEIERLRLFGELDIVLGAEAKRIRDRCYARARRSADKER